MNKVQHINLGGFPFTIDEDAFEHLSNYLETIHRHFQGSEGYEEITNDIEARMAELFQESLGGPNSIITVKEVRDAIVIMGTPEDFGAEPLEEEPTLRRSNGSSGSGYRPGKRLFRNPEDEVLGGVCSGIAAYFGIADPLWIRLLFIVITISGGFGIPAYLILWAILPKAVTASDRLAMRGEPINASNIGKIIEEEFQHISEKVSEFGSELGGKKKEFSTSGGANALGEALRTGVGLIGQVLQAVITVVSKLWKPLLILIGGALILAFAIAWIATIGSVVFAWPLFEFFSPELPFLSILGAFNLLIIIGMVLLGLVLMITRLLYGTRMGSAWRTGLGAFWVLNIISLFVVLPIFARQFAEEGEITRQLSLEAIPTDTLQLRMGKSFHGNSWFQVDELKLVNDQLISKEINLYIEKAEGQEFELAQKNKARGYSFNTAENLAQAIHYQVEQEGNQLTLPTYFSISKGEKWRAQEVRLYLSIPVGKSIFIDGNVYNYVSRIPKAEEGVYLYRNPNQIWTMTEEGLICTSCTSDGEQGLSFEDFNKIFQEGHNKVDLHGSYSFLKASLSGHAKLDAEKAEVTEADINASGASKVKLGAVSKLAQQADESSQVSVEGY